MGCAVHKPSLAKSAKIFKYERPAVLILTSPRVVKRKILRCQEGIDKNTINAISEISKSITNVN